MKVSMSACKYDWNYDILFICVAVMSDNKYRLGVQKPSVWKTAKLSNPFKLQLLKRGKLSVLNSPTKSIFTHKALTDQREIPALRLQKHQDISTFSPHMFSKSYKQDWRGGHCWALLGEI